MFLFENIYEFFVYIETYGEGIKKLRELNNQSYAYTTDNNENGQEKAQTMTDIYKSRNNKELDINQLLSDKNLLSSSDSKDESDDNYEGKLLIINFKV